MKLAIGARKAERSRYSFSLRSVVFTVPGLSQAILAVQCCGSQHFLKVTDSVSAPYVSLTSLLPSPLCPSLTFTKALNQEIVLNAKIEFDHLRISCIS